MALLLHISDTHFGTEVPRVVAALERLAKERRPDVLVYSGDLTQRARDAEFAGAKRLADALGAPKTLVLPGNHDIPLFNVAGRLLKPYSGYMHCFGPRLEPVIETLDFLVIGVNTTRPSRHKNGEVSAEQVGSVSQQLRSAGTAQLRIVVTHQPAEVVREKDVHDRLIGAEPALQAWSSAGADLVLGGHIHLPYVADLTQRPTPTPRRMWCVQAGTATSDRLRHDTSNSVNLIHWKAAAPGSTRVCHFERCDYSAAADAFEMVEKRELLLA